MAIPGIRSMTPQKTGLMTPLRLGGIHCESTRHSALYSKRRTDEHSCGGGCPALAAARSLCEVKYLPRETISTYSRKACYVPRRIALAAVAQFDTLLQRISGGQVQYLPTRGCHDWQGCVTEHHRPWLNCISDAPCPPTLLELAGPPPSKVL